MGKIGLNRYLKDSITEILLNNTDNDHFTEAYFSTQAAVPQYDVHQLDFPGLTKFFVSKWIFQNLTWLQFRFKITKWRWWNIFKGNCFSKYKYTWANIYVILQFLVKYFHKFKVNFVKIKKQTVKIDLFVTTVNKFQKTSSNNFYSDQLHLCICLCLIS